jgi:hypothetical protein
MDDDESPGAGFAHLSRTISEMKAKPEKRDFTGIVWIGIAADSYTPDQLANFDAEIAEANAWEAAKGTPGGRKAELTDIKWEQTAARYSHELYQLLYRSFSADGAHFTLDALQRVLVVDEKGRITGLNVGPDSNGAGHIHVLSGAVLMFIWSAAPFAEINGLTDDAATIQARVQEFEKLPNAFPTFAPFTRTARG